MTTDTDKLRELGAQNTDREIYREREGDFYADSIHVTASGGIGFNVGGFVQVKPLREWAQMAQRHQALLDRIDALEAENAGPRKQPEPSGDTDKLIAEIDVLHNARGSA